ncbi:MAG: carbohydrate ABC transporter permease [Spirochaetota bacterium]
MHTNSNRALSYALTYLILGFFAITVLVPMLWAVGTSLKTYGEVFSQPLAFIPDVPQWDNYAEIFRIAPFARYFVNTVIVSLFVCAITLLTSAMSAYAFARLRFPGRETIFVLYLATMMIPQQVILIPNFVIIREMGLIDSLTALILTRSFLPLGTFLLRQFFMGIPQELEEAAVIDGLGYTKRFVSIILPLAKPALVSLLIITLLLAWNDYLYPLVFIQSDANRTLTLGLSILQGDLDVRWNLVLAATLVTVAPLVVVYLALQRFFIEGIALSGTKG